MSYLKNIRFMQINLMYQKLTRHVNILTNGICNKYTKNHQNEEFIKIGTEK